MGDYRIISKEEWAMYADARQLDKFFELPKYKPCLTWEQIEKVLDELENGYTGGSEYLYNEALMDAKQALKTLLEAW